MKIAFLITSTIEVEDNNNYFIYQPHLKRSFWTTQQRFDQTVNTINQIKKVVPNADVFLIDSSKNYLTYRDFFEKSFTDLRFVSVENIDFNSAKICQTSKVKGLCESLLLKSFVNNYKQLEDYDFVIKITGRYLLSDNFNTEILNENTLNKFIFTKFISWVDIENHRNKGYENYMVNNKFPYILTCLYGLGKYQLDKYKNTLDKVISEYQKGHIDDVALETVFYHYLNINTDDYILSDWDLTCFCGVTGQTIYY